jgi:tripartite-type tricarboxylate transporter receptor subunit TctC
LMSHGASSQTPRTIKVVDPNAPGGSTDILARLLAEQIGRAQGTTIVVENRPGAGTVIGTEAVSRAAPDGNTLLLTQSSFLINPLLRKQNYHPLTSFEPICYLVSLPTVVVVNSASPYRTLADLLNAARAKPGSLTIASVPGGAVQISIEMLRRSAHVDMTFVPYPGSAPQVTALLGEHVTAILVPYSVVADHLKSGRLRALATPSSRRIETLPDVPTLAESGYKEAEVDGWTGLVAPAKTPKETVSQLAGWFIAAMQVAEVRAKLVVQGQFPVGLCGADFAADLRKQYEEFGRIIREANIKAE